MEAFQERLRGWGVNDDSLVVIYDDSRTIPWHGPTPAHSDYLRPIGNVSI